MSKDKLLTETWKKQLEYITSVMSDQGFIDKITNGIKVQEKFGTLDSPEAEELYEKLNAESKLTRALGGV